jgi:alanyl-tRNA synthetase
MGLERILSIIENTNDNYKTSVVFPLVQKSKELFNVNDNIANIAADHSKTTLFLLNEGLIISSEGAGYVLRRIIRRALTYLKQPGFWQLLPEVVKIYENVYTFSNLNLAIEMVKKEEELFFNTIKNGYDKLKQNLDANNVDESVVFKLYETYGLPLEFSSTILEERGIILDKNKIHDFMESHKKVSGQMMNIEFHQFNTNSTCYEKLEEEAKVELLLINNEVLTLINKKDEEFLLIADTSPFYSRGGGQEGDKGIIYNDSCKIEVINTTKKNKTILHTCKLISGSLKTNDIIKMKVNEEWRKGTSIHHSATHLLQEVLQKMFGKQVEQKGSFITNNRFRFDFNLARALTEEEKDTIEQQIETWIKDRLSVNIAWLPFVVAKAKGAEYLSNMTYEENVRVVSIGNVSFVVCGGIHVTNTAEIPTFKILNEKSVGSGIRRLEVSCV